MKKILIVEDDYDIGEIVEMALNTKYQVLVKRDTVQLVKVLRQYNPDVILIDNYIGQKDAVQIIEEINADGFHLVIPMILFSAHHNIQTIATQIGAVEFIKKPFDLDELDRCISRVLLYVGRQQFSNN